MKENIPNDRYLQLAEKWLTGTITPEEEKEYAEWYNKIDPDATLKIPLSVASSEQQHHKKILDRINLRRIPVVPIHVRFRKIAAAAIFTGLMIGVGTLYFTGKSKYPTASIQNRSETPTDIKPGVNGAVLTLANGKTIVLDTTSNGKLTTDGSADITKTSAAVSFISTDKSIGDVYNTLTTPRARQQQLVLPDGSQVWLNAESSIKFPSAFNGNRRIVEITGEAYFEIAKDAARPFVVNVNNAKVEVLGTHFNVMAYNNEKVLKTTLLEGSVRFNKDGHSILLKPGEQSQLLPNEQIILEKDADVELALAWKNGKQAFSGADIQTVLRQIERWYDVDVEYEGNISSETFTGDIPRSANLSELIRLLEINKIHVRMDAGQKKLIVTP